MSKPRERFPSSAHMIGRWTLIFLKADAGKTRVLPEVLRVFMRVSLSAVCSFTLSQILE